MKKFIAAFVGIAFLFSTVSAPLVEANFWKERRDAARTKNSTGQGVQYAMAPGAKGALADALPLVGSFDSAMAGSAGAGQAHLLAARSVLSPEQIKLMPAWLNTISSAHGSISAAYFAPNAADRPLVVHIQDVHEQREAQMNISGLISEVVNTGAVSLVGLEGATGAFDLVPYRTFPNKAVIEDVADFFLQEHLIGGGEHAGWTMEKEPTLWGIEEVNVYLKNLNSFKDSLPIQQRVQDRIKSWEYRLAQAKPKVYSPGLKSFDEAQARYRTDSMPLPDFVALMEKSVKIEDKKYPAMAAFKKCLTMEKGIDFADVERERARLIESLTKALSEKEISALVQRTLLYKSGHLTYGGYYDSLQTICETRGVSLSRFPAMASYIKYVLASEQIKPEALLEELDMIQDQVASTLVRSADERAVYELAQDLHSLANLTAFKMAPRDWETYQRTRDRIMDMAARMDQIAPGADNYKGDLPKDLVSFEGFCQAALKRDETLVNNLLAKMKETNQKTGLLLAGGFHTQGMTELLKKGKVSYVVFTPTLTEVSSDSHYLDFLKDRPALEKLFTQEKITTKAPINASAASPTPGYESAKESVNGLAKTVVTALSDGQETPLVKELSQVTVQKTVAGVYTSQANGKEVSVAVGEGSENKSGLGKLVAAFSGKVSPFAIYVKDRGIASYLSPTALVAKVVDLFSGQNRPPSTEPTETRNFMKTGQLVIGGLGVVAASVSIFGLTYAALVSVGVFGLLGVLLHEVAGHLGVYSFLGGKGGKLMFGREGVWAQTDDLGFRNNAWVAIAGPLANIFFAAVAGLLLWAGVDSSALQAFAATNLIFGVTTLIPFGKESDIRQFADFWSKADKVEAMSRRPIVLTAKTNAMAWGSEVWTDSTRPEGMAMVAPGISLADVVKNKPEVLGRMARLLFGDQMPIFTKFLRTNFDPLVHMGFKENVNRRDYEELLNKEQGNLQVLYSVLNLTNENDFAQFNLAYGKWAQAQALQQWAINNQQDTANSEFLNALIRLGYNSDKMWPTLDTLRATRQELVAPLNEINLNNEVGNLLLSFAGMAHAIFGLSHQTHPLDPAAEMLMDLFGEMSRLISQGQKDGKNEAAIENDIENAINKSGIRELREQRKADPKSEAWLVAVMDGVLTLVEPQQTSATTYSFADMYTPFIYKNGRMVFRKGGDFTGLSPASIRDYLNSVDFNASPVDQLRKKPRLVEQNELGAKVYELVNDGQTWPFFTARRLDLAGNETNPAEWRGQHPRGAYQQLIVIQGTVKIRDDLGEPQTISPKPNASGDVQAAALIPASMVGSYTLEASEDAKVLILSVPLPQQPSPSDIAMDGMDYSTKVDKANEIFNQLQQLHQQTDVAPADRIRQIRSIVDDLFKLQRDGNLGDVQHIATLVVNQLQTSGRLDEVQRLFSRAFNLQHRTEKIKIGDYNRGTLPSLYAVGGLDTNGKEAKKRELLNNLSNPKNSNRFSNVAKELNRLDPRDGLEILESMVSSLSESPKGRTLAIDLLKALENEIVGATIRAFDGARLQQLQKEVSQQSAIPQVPPATGGVNLAEPKDVSPAVSENPSAQFKQIKANVGPSQLVDPFNKEFDFISQKNFKPKIDRNGQPYGPMSPDEALAELRGKLNDDLSRVHTAVADSASLSAESQRYALSIQTLLMDALLIVGLMERGVKGADRVRLTTNPDNQLTADNRATSFLNIKTLPVGVSDKENGIGAYNRGIETGLKMAADLTDSSGQTPRNLDAYVLYAMRHGLVPVPQGLRSITRAAGGTISTFHHTIFGMRNVPQASGSASTGVGHNQANQLDIKQVTRGEAIQVLVAYNSDGSVRDVLYQRAKAGEYLTALPGYFDYMITTGNEPMEFDDVSINLSQLGFTAEQIAQFKGGVQPSTKPPQKAPYVYVNGKLTPATGLSGQIPPIREIASIQAHQGASLLDIYGLLDESSLRSVAQSLVDNAGALVATTYRGRQPKPLAFGTSGLRGLVTEITDLEVYINTLGYLNYLQTQGQIRPGDSVVIARDFRDSSPRIASAVAQAIVDFGAQVEDLGRLSTPALTLWGIQNNVVSVMITGSHIPFDRNGIKFNKASGEVVKADEPGINQQVSLARGDQYRKAPSDSLFDNAGNFKKTPENRLIDVGADRSHDKAYVNRWTSANSEIADSQSRQFSQGEEAYINRYVSVYGANALAGQSYAIYLHSGVGTRLFAEILRRLGANVYEFGPSDKFIAIDTEAIGNDTLASISEMVNRIPAPPTGTLTSVLSTDGDSDRPLVLGVNGDERNLDFIPGDIAGAFVASRLNADAVAIPISSNDNVDTFLQGVRIVKTKIGSPHIVVAMEALAKANPGKTVVGWEANGGFLTGVEIPHRNGTLAALPTRDAVLPMVEILVAAKEEATPVSELFEALRKRFGSADLIDNFPVPVSAAIISQFSLASFGVTRVVFNEQGKVKVVNAPNPNAEFLTDPSPATEIRSRLQQYFSSELGFGQIDWIDFTDGIRIHFTNNNIAHIRPSGNAPQLRIYAVADTFERANQIVQRAIGERGIYRQIQADLSSASTPQSFVGRYGPAGGLLTVQAKPFSVVRKLAYAVGFNVAAIVVVAYGLVAGYFFPLILLAMTLPYGLVAGGAFVALNNLAQNEKGDINVLFDGIRRFSYDPTVRQGSNDVQVKIGKRNVTVKFGAPTGGRFNGNFRFAETTRESTKATITVRPGTPAWLLPIVLSQEIYRVDWWKGVQSTLDLMLGLPEATYSSGWVIPQKRDQATSADTRGPPVETIEEDLSVNMDEVYPVIMSGGDSTRLFPVDKVLTPNLDASGNGRSLMRQMFERLTQDRENGEFLPFSRFFMLTASRIADTVKQQLPEVPSDNLLSDPAKRNTFPAILWAVAHIKVKTDNPRATLTVFGADQVVGDTAEFRRVVTETARVAQNAKSVVAIGIQPSENPVQWTNYGAIKAPNLAGVGRESRGMDRFVEKPNEEKAREMLQEGGHYWNAGWFTFTIEALEEAMSTNQPAMFAIYNEMLEAIGRNDNEGAKKAFEKFPSKIKQKGTEVEVDNSMDYAIMEYLGQDTPVKGVVVPGGFPWIDAGNWGDVRQVLPADVNGNVIRGTVVAHGTKNSTMFAESGMTIKAVGLDGIAVAVSATGNVIVTEEVKGGKVKPAVEPAKKEVAKDVSDPTRVNVVQKESDQVTVTNTGPGVVAVYGVKNLEIEVTKNSVVVRNTARTWVDAGKVAVGDLPVPPVRVMTFASEKEKTQDFNNVYLPFLVATLFPEDGKQDESLPKGWTEMSPRRIITWLQYATASQQQAGLGLLREYKEKAEGVLGVVALDAAAAHAKGISYKSGQTISEAGMHNEMQEVAQLGFWLGLSIDQAQRVIDRTYNLQRTLIENAKPGSKDRNLESVRIRSHLSQARSMLVGFIVNILRKIAPAVGVKPLDAPIVTLPIVKGPNGVEWQQGVDDAKKKEVRDQLDKIKKGSEKTKSYYAVVAQDKELTENEVKQFLTGEGVQLPTGALLVTGNSPGVFGEGDSIYIPAVARHIARNGYRWSFLRALLWHLQMTPQVYTTEPALLDLGDYRDVIKVFLLLLGKVEPLDLDNYNDKVERYIKAQA